MAFSVMMFYKKKNRILVNTQTLLLLWIIKFYGSTLAIIIGYKQICNSKKEIRNTPFIVVNKSSLMRQTILFLCCKYSQNIWHFFDYPDCHQQFHTILWLPREKIWQLQTINGLFNCNWMLISIGLAINSFFSCNIVLSKVIAEIWQNMYKEISRDM